MDTEQEQLDRFLELVEQSPQLRSRLKGADPYTVVEIAEQEGFQFGVVTLYKSTCTGYVMKRPEWPH